MLPLKRSPIALSLFAAVFLTASLAAATPATANGGSPPVNTDPPTISGAPGVGRTLTADPGTWTGDPTPTFTYQWERCVPDYTRTTLNSTSTGTSPFDVALDGSGNVYTANNNFNLAGSVTKITPAGVTSLFANTGNGSRSLAFDSTGNLYTANYSGQGINKITPGGVVSLFSLAPTGAQGIAVDSSDTVYTANFLNASPRNVSRLTAAGDLSVSWADTGTGSNPFDVAVDSTGNIYTTNSGTNTVSKITPAGVVSTFASLGAGTTPYGIAIDSAGNVYTANYGSGTVSKITPGGLVSTFAAPGAGLYDIEAGQDGLVYVTNFTANTAFVIGPGGTTLQTITGFSGPRGIAVAPNGTAYTADSVANSVSKIAPTLTCTEIDGATEDEYTLTADDKDKRIRVKVTGTNGSGDSTADSDATAFVREPPANTSVPTISPGGTPEVGQTLTADEGTWTGDPTFSYQWQRCEEGGSSILADVGTSPRGIVVDPAGNVFTANQTSRNVSRVTPDGSSSIYAQGTGSPTFKLFNAKAITRDPAGNLYVTSAGVTIGVWKVEPTADPAVGDIITPSLGNTGTDPIAIVRDSAGNIFTANNQSGNVTKIQTNGTTTNFSIAPGVEPTGIALDASGNIYTSNSFTNNITKLMPDGTPAGSPWPVSTGADTFPAGIVLDGQGNIYTANRDSSSVAKFLPDGQPAGAPWPVSTGEDTFPNAITFDSAGNLYTGNDSPGNENDSVTKITPDGSASIIGRTGGIGPRAIAVDSEGNVYTANEFSHDVTKISAVGACTDIDGATGDEYTLTGADEGKKIRVKVTGTNDAGSTSANSAPTANVAPEPPAPPANTEPPTISGEAEVGEKLTADPGTWSGNPAPTFTYQWQRCDASGSNCVNISGATGSEYTLTSADEGSRIRVVVTASNSEGTETANSEATALVPVPGPGPDPGPTPSGKPKLKLSVETPNKVRAGKSFRIEARTSNVARATTARTASTRSGTTATKVKTCVELGKGLFVVRSGGGKVKGRTICWTRSSLAAGNSVTYKPTVRSSKTMSGSIRVTGTATASGSSAAPVKASGSSKVRIVEPKKPKPKPPTG